MFLAADSGQLFALERADLSLASRLVALEHDQIVGSNIPFDDGFEEETRAMEVAAEDHMNAPDSSAEDEDAINNGAILVE